MKYAHKDALLIDDQARNIDAWEAVGGVPLHHIDSGLTAFLVRAFVESRRGILHSQKTTQFQGKKLRERGGTVCSHPR